MNYLFEVLLEDVRVSRLDDAHASDTEELSAGGSELDVVSGEWNGLNVSDHGEVLQLGLSDDWHVLGDQNHLGLSLPMLTVNHLIAFKQLLNPRVTFPDFITIARVELRFSVCWDDITALLNSDDCLLVVLVVN